MGDRKIRPAFKRYSIFSFLEVAEKIQSKLQGVCEQQRTTFWSPLGLILFDCKKGESADFKDNGGISRYEKEATKYYYC